MSHENLELMMLEFARHKKIELFSGDHEKALKSAAACDNIVRVAFLGGHSTTCFIRIILPSTTIH